MTEKYIDVYCTNIRKNDFQLVEIENSSINVCFSKFTVGKYIVLG